MRRTVSATIDGTSAPCSPRIAAPRARHRARLGSPRDRPTDTALDAAPSAPGRAHPGCEASLCRLEHRNDAPPARGSRPWLAVAALPEQKWHSIWGVPDGENSRLSRGCGTRLRRWSEGGPIDLRYVRQKRALEPSTVQSISSRKSPKTRPSVGLATCLTQRPNNDQAPRAAT